MKKTFSYKAESPSLRLDVYLHEKTGESRTFIQEQIELGHIFVNEKVCLKASHKVTNGDLVSGTLEEKLEVKLEPIAHPLEIIYEDDHVLCLNKPQDMVVHPASGFKGPTLVHHLLHYFIKHPDFRTLKEGRPGIVHRLDRGTSGVILVAKNRKAQDLFSQMFKKRQIKKEYEAVVWGLPPKRGIWDSPVGRDRKDRKKMSSKSDKLRPAITRFETLFTTKTFSHVGLFPETGRTHQLRVHLSENRFPIVGDGLYGPKSLKSRLAHLNSILQTATEGLGHTLLHAKRVSFQHPITGTDLCLEAPRPSGFDKFLALMKNFDK